MRAERLNEAYYERNNEPSFGQLKKDFDFYDEKGRFYWIAQENEDSFQNKRLRQYPDKKSCVVNSYGEVSLYVKLGRGAEWFSDEDGWRSFTIVSQYTRQNFDVRLASEWKGLEKRRTGTIEVKGLGQELCDSLILLKFSSSRRV